MKKKKSGLSKSDVAIAILFGLNIVLVTIMILLLTGVIGV